MYAIVETGGKQYRAEPQGVLEVEKLAGEPGQEVVLDRVLLVADRDSVLVGDPVLEGATVVCRVLEQHRGEKIRGFKYKPKKNYRRTWGHRQWLSKLQVEEIRVAPSA